MPGNIGRLGFADNSNHFVDIIQRNPQAFEDVGTRPGAFQFKFRAAGNHFAAEIDVGLQGFPDIDNLGLPVDHYQHIGGKRGLHGRVFIEIVQHRFRLDIPL